MNYKSKVNIGFVVTGSYIDYNLFTEKTGIIPTIWRTKEDWPEVIKRNPNLPEELKPRYEWGISYEMEKDNSIDEAIKILMNKLDKGKNNLISLCREMDLETSIIISLHEADAYVPELCIMRETVKELAEMDAEIIFDIC